MSGSKHVHLHNHSHFSLLDGAQNIDAMVARAKSLGMSALAITDHGNLHGSLKFHKTCLSHGINPILGYEAYLTDGKRTDRTQKSETYHLTVLAKNRTGWQNLIKLSSSAYIDGFYYKPRIDREILHQLKDGLIILSGCVSSQLSRAVLNGESSVCRDVVEWYSKTFGRDFYLEIMHNGTEYQRLATQGIIEISERVGIPTIATADCHYTLPTDHDLQDTMVCISTGRTRNSPVESPRMSEQCYYMRSPEEMHEIFGAGPCERSQEIADQVDIQIETGVRHFPVFNVPEMTGHKNTPETHIRTLCAEGLSQHGISDKDEYWDRLRRELKVIHDLGFDEYFLVVSDFCRYAASVGITYTARGSGVGSLVCYCLGISHVDPIAYGLLFERFLDPSRREAPDIDVDFCKDRRAEVIQYVKDKYGEDCVAQIGTFGTLAAKSAVQAVGKAECLSTAKIDAICKMIPELPGTTLEDAIEKSPQLTELLDKDYQCQRVFDMSLRIEGMARSVGTHAAGVVVSDKPLINYVPLMLGKEGGIVTQWDMGDVEEAGLLKVDFLGLRNLTILARAIRAIEESTGKRINIHKIPVDDPKVYQLLARGETKGIFQLESTGMSGLLMRMRPDNIENIIACIALYRPGPLDAGMVDEYIAVKNGTKQATYPHPAMESILSVTYGVMVYQEQVMQVLHQVGGIPLSESYSCIKAISKKIKSKVDKYKPMFVSGCSANGVDGEALWEQITTFARYGFNKSHSTAYAMIGYQTAYLKTYYPIEFMCSLLNCDIDQRNYTGRDPLVEHLDDCRRMGIEVLAPHVNDCSSQFKARHGKIYWGLGAIKGVPMSAGDYIAAAAKQGPFHDLFDFCARVPKSQCPRAAIRSLIQVGAMAGPHNRDTMELTIDRAMKLAAGEYKVPQKMQNKWTDPNTYSMPDDLLAREHELTGVYLTGHPLYSYPELCLIGPLSECDPESQVFAAGVISSIETRHTLSGKPFITFMLEAPNHSTECIVWDPGPLIKKKLIPGTVVVARGQCNRRGSNNTLTVRSIIDAKVHAAQWDLGISISTRGQKVPSRAINQLVSQHPGTSPVFLVNSGNTFTFDGRVTMSRTLIRELRNAIGYGGSVGLVETKKQSSITRSEE